jgi:VRR-NUC domain
VTEDALLELVRGLAGQLGLLATHRRDSRRDAGWSSGFPDLVIVSPAGHGVIFAELKSEGGRLSRDQQRWFRGLQACGQVYVLWRPADWASGEIRQRLLMLAQS